MMQGLGYANCYYEKSNYMSASAIFYKADKYDCLISNKFPYSPGESMFLMFGLFCLKSDDTNWFVFGETHLKAKPANMAQRVK